MPEGPNPTYFSSAAEVAPVRAPQLPAAPAPIHEMPKRPGSRKPWFIAAAVLLAVLLGALLLRRSAEPAPATGPEALRTYTVERKDFVRSVRIHGIVEAVQSHMIAAPRLSGQGLGSLVITKLVRGGSAVKRGDLLVEFDRQAQLKNVLDKQAEYRDLLEQIKKKQAEQATARAADETELKAAENAVQTAELEVKKNEIISQIDAEKNQENLDEARARFAQLRETFDLKRRAARAELRILEIQRDRSRTAMRWSQKNTEKMLIRSSMDGVAVVNTIWKSGTMSEVQEGDEIRAGLPFMQVVDPSRMQVRSRINQADIRDLQLGEAVKIGLDAYPELTFPGRVDGIAAVGQTSGFSQRVHSFTAVFAIEGADPKLLPDLSAAVDVELKREKNVLVVPRDAVVSDDGHTYLMTQSGGSFAKHEVQLGAANDLEQVIVSGVEKGAVVLRNPKP